MENDARTKSTVKKEMLAGRRSSDWQRLSCIQQRQSWCPASKVCTLTFSRGQSTAGLGAGQQKHLLPPRSPSSYRTGHRRLLCKMKHHLVGVRGYFLLTLPQICNPAVKLCQSQLIRQQFTLPTLSWLLPPNHVSFANVQPRYQFRERPPCSGAGSLASTPGSPNSQPAASDSGAIMSTDAFGALGLQRRSHMLNNGFLCNKLRLVTRICDLCTLAPCVHRIKPGKKSNTAEQKKRACWGRDSGRRFLQTYTPGAVPVLASSKSVPEPGAGSQFIQHPSWQIGNLVATTHHHFPGLYTLA